MDQQLKHKKVAMLVADGFEQVEMTEPRKALEEAGASVEIVSPSGGRVKAWKTREWGDEFEVDVVLSAADASDYDALVLPGGVMNPDKLRTIPEARAFVRAFVDANKPVAAICHGPWTLVDARAVRGKKVTSWPSLATDLANAGANWVDQEVVVDGTLVTSRKPDDIPAFNRETIALIARKSNQPREQRASAE
ncbi:MAG TPA: type 1 glutamine amidotransferase domain-containing protein [Polyangiaceae bacterium]